MAIKTKVSSYYRAVESDTLATAFETNQIAVRSELKDRNLGVRLDDKTYRTTETGYLCSFTVDVGGYGGRKEMVEQSAQLFVRVNEVTISEKVLNQVRQAFDGIYVGVYGGGISRITVSGITKMWSGPWYNETNIPNTEIRDLRNLMAAAVDSRGTTFEFHDGLRTRKWKVIPSTFSSERNVQLNNLEKYEFSFLGASFNQNFNHVESSRGKLQEYSGPVARYHIRQVF